MRNTVVAPNLNKTKIFKRSYFLKILGLVLDSLFGNRNTDVFDCSQKINAK